MMSAGKADHTLNAVTVGSSGGPLAQHFAQPDFHRAYLRASRRLLKAFQQSPDRESADAPARLYNVPPNRDVFCGQRWG
jgi:hypothetical protein